MYLKCSPNIFSCSRQKEHVSVPYILTHFSHRHWATFSISSTSAVFWLLLHHNKNKKDNTNQIPIIFFIINFNKIKWPKSNNIKLIINKFYNISIYFLAKLALPNFLSPVSSLSNHFGIINFLLSIGFVNSISAVISHSNLPWYRSISISCFL